MAAAGQIVPSPTLPLDAERVDLLARLVHGLDAPGLLWISGYAAGLAAASNAAWSAPADAAAAIPTAAPDDDSLRVATIVHGSQTGNGRRIAEALGERLLARGMRVRVLRAGEYEPRELVRERRLFVVMSTHGDGDPPDDARPLTDFLLGRRAPKLTSLEFAVLALGDSSYPKYCDVGRRIDERLAELGGRRVFDFINF